MSKYTNIANMMSVLRRLFEWYVVKNYLKQYL